MQTVAQSFFKLEKINSQVKTRFQARWFSIFKNEWNLNNSKFVGEPNATDHNGRKVKWQII